MNGQTRTYFTVQMSANAPGGRHCIHLGKDTETGGLGDNICRNSRHGKDPQTGESYGFSANGGGHSDPDAWACEGCKVVLRYNPGPVRGVFASLFDGVVITPASTEMDR